MLLKILITILLIIGQITPWVLEANSFVMKRAVKVPSIEELLTQEPVEVFLFGDVMLGRYIATLRSRYAEEDPTFPLTYLPDIISAFGVDPEVVAVNLEGPITDTQISYCELCFRFLPETADLLTSQGVTMVGLANNHIFNQGQNGYDQTIEYSVEAGLNYIGNNSTAVQEINGFKIGWLAFNEVESYLDYSLANQLISDLAAETDFVIAGIHWGTEYVNTPSSTIQSHAHDFIDSGADMVWGTHPHVIQSIENYSDGMIFYSLGNFVFDQYWSSGTQEGLGVMLEFEDPDDPTYTLIPIKLTTNRGDPYLMEGDERAGMLSRLQQYSESIGVLADSNMDFANATLKPW